MTQPVVAVTGATGFIGRRIVGRLTDLGYSVRALARRPAHHEQAEDFEAVSWVRGSLSEADALAALVDGAAAVVHCAGAIKAASRDAFLDTNSAGTRRLAEAAAAAAVPPRFIHLSSIAAREPQLSHYAASKYAGERAVLALQGRLSAIILRPPAVYGPGDPETLRIFQMAARGYVPSPMVQGARLSLVHVDDVAAAVMAALEWSGAPPEPIEFDDGKAGAYTWADIAAAAGAALRNSPRVIPIPAPAIYLAGAAASLAAYLTRRPTVLSWGKVPELLHPDWAAQTGFFPGYKPFWNLDKGFKDTVTWYTSRGLLTS